MTMIESKNEDKQGMLLKKTQSNCKIFKKNEKVKVSYDMKIKAYYLIRFTFALITAPYGDPTIE